MVNELKNLVGWESHWDLGGVQVQCKIVNARMNYGRVEVLIEPIAGVGTIWKTARRRELDIMSGSTSKRMEAARGE